MSYSNGIRESVNTNFEKEAKTMYRTNASSHVIDLSRAANGRA